MSGVFCRRGVSRGAATPAFSAADLLLATHHTRNEHVYVEPDAAGALRVCGAAGGSGAEGGAALAVAARVAPHVLAAGAALELRGAALRVRVTQALAPHAELQLWFDAAAAAALALPHLTPRNIRARRAYACHLCAAEFPDPNPLKVHLFLACAPPDAAALWREAARRLRAPQPAPAPPPPLAAQLEALATEWGRAAGGHRCVYCGKLYSRRYGLKIHIRTHTGYRPLRCRYCLRAFGDPSNLNKHVRLHARGERGQGAAPHQCGVCGRALARRRDLERHLRTHAGEE